MNLLEKNQEAGAQGVGENPLSEREMEVARLLSTGASNGEIAQQLVLSPHTIKVHLRNIYAKLAVNSRTEASMVLLQQGWLAVPGVEVTTAERAALLPEPPPLAHRSARLLPWQRIYLVVALLLCLLAAALPLLFVPVGPSLSVLSDGQLTSIGRPVVETLPRWDLYTPLPQPRSRLALVLLGDRLYAIGGEGRQGQPLTDLTAYDLEVNQWQELPPLPHPLANLAAASFGGEIFVAGGSGSGAPFETDAAELVGPRVSDELWAYGVESLRWRQVGTLPVPVAGAGLVGDGSALYLIGGWDGSGPRDEIWRWQPGGDLTAPVQWELVARMAAARAFLGTVLVERQLYVVGGYDGQREVAAAAVLALDSGLWQELAPLAVARAGLSLTYDGANILALGGGWTQPTATHERFDIFTGQWSNFPSPIGGAWRHLAAVNRDGNLHLIGGWSGDYLDIHLRYQSRYFNFFPVNFTN